MAKVTSIKLQVQSGTDRTVFVTWAWTKKNTDSYKVKWSYHTGDGVWFTGEETSLKVKQAIYNAPSNATKVRVKIQPIAKKKKNKKTRMWSADWASADYKFTSNPPTKPSAPTVTIKEYTLSAELDNLNVNGKQIEFQVVQDDLTVFATKIANIRTYHATYSFPITLGHKYKVRCRAIRGDERSAWSDFSSDVDTVPSPPTAINDLRALSKTSIYIEWTKVINATSYEIQYTTDVTYFDSSKDVQSTTVESSVYHAEVTGLETGHEYFFRVRSINNQGNSTWTEIKSLTIGKVPAPPTTWSSTTTAKVGGDLVLYWVHNSQDGSSETFWEVELTVNGNTTTHDDKKSTDEDEKDKTSSYSVDTSKYTEGAQLKWRVRTAGVTKEYGDWSVQRTVDIYAPPTLALMITDDDAALLETVTAFPFYVSAIPGPDTQQVIGYQVTIIAKKGYKSVDDFGNEKRIRAGDIVYQKYIDTSENLLLELSASNIDLHDGTLYKITCVSTMNSGLTAKETAEFDVEWTENMVEPNAEIAIVKDDISAIMRPYCAVYPTVCYKVIHDESTETYTATDEVISTVEGDLVTDVKTDTGEDVYSAVVSGVTVYFYMAESEEGTLVENTVLSVYRKEYDGRFVEIIKDAPNSASTFITDPHPALDYARYRIVAKSLVTGAISFYDPPGEPVDEKAVVISWNEKWNSFEFSDEDGDEPEEPNWGGEMLKLPYNIDVAEANNIDVALIEYIGRSHPVSYYGTQLGCTSTWNVDIPKSDTETLYALRRLAIWTGDVYVREPSGSGYWASISVSMSQKHCELTIPVTFSITRVEGGM